ncbi:unnamed protein product [Kuraishia capsulata CBS 1993]|uniref:Palmitoyltransferase n=1 Tax=Kuraishia capsulata CBS 1993 TaxID=1382522 RepID=W6MGC5_9ASCO|nr:uncharacterized protein KUCA_T00000488001 [Kuraishia capsulata CBS 1993]CDK24523.1 unnamed protein product [Kuraishia capsulata CBS 1993]
MARNRVQPVITFAVPVVLLGLLGYLDYGYSKVFCYDQLYVKKNRRACAIGFIVEFNLLLGEALLLWIITALKGPGKLNQQLKPFDLGPYIQRGQTVYANDKASFPTTSKLERIPDMFLCNSEGFPFWCSECKTLKIRRSHHVKSLGRCVPRFDHKCMFLGVVIGENNLLCFFGAVFYFWLFFLFGFITITVFASSIRDYTSASGMKIIEPNIIACYIGDIFWLLMMTFMFFGQISLFMDNDTSIDVLHRRRRSRERKMNRTVEPDFVNVAHPTLEDVRVIVELRERDRVFDKGYRSNIQSIFKTDTWKALFYPSLGSGAEEPSIESGESDLIAEEEHLYSQKFQQTIQKRIENGDGRIMGS